MAHSVDRSFCLSRCFEKGVCFAVDGTYRCLCDDGRISEDCAPIRWTSSPIPTLVATAEEDDPLYVLPLIAVFMLGMALLLGVVQVICCYVRREARRQLGPVAMASAEAPRTAVAAGELVAMPPLPEAGTSPRGIVCSSGESRV
ncbi:unnamed protein product [Heligmosomoides polygyrus]|uniref:EGF-like domain-containing protein n=1 Tax=Heligmosomoides polygyrus TaxID=6339 RepID=A0A183FRA7_HELPZ|nr:unnamed protein product [Heligmosomoides polygyrus]